MENDEFLKKQQELEQVHAFLGDNYPPLWRRLYDNMLKEGFNETQSFILLQTFILKDATHGVNGTGN
jgi:hypothetical protein